MMQAIIDALTLPLLDEEKIEVTPPETEVQPRLLPPDTEDNLQLATLDLRLATCSLKLIFEASIPQR